MLQAYWWPGNIRELENLIERLVAISDKSGSPRTTCRSSSVIAELDAQTASGESLFDEAMRAFERNFILRALEKNGWNVTGDGALPGPAALTLKFKMERLDMRELAEDGCGAACREREPERRARRPPARLRLRARQARPRRLLPRQDRVLERLRRCAP